MTDFRFQDSAFLWWLAAIPLITVLFQLTLTWGQAKLARFARLESLKALIRGVSDAAFGARVLLLSIGVALALFALARPQGNPTSERRETSGLDILVLLDISRSMNAEDVYPSRLGRAKKTIEQLMAQLSGDRIGVVAFAGSAVVAVPLTGDYETANLFLESVDTDLIENQGTDFSHAVRVGTEALERGGAGNATERSRLMIVMSDGEFHLGDWENAVKEAKEKGVVFFSIALGTARGAPIPVRDARGELVGHKRDAQGETVVTKADETVLKKIAADGGGVFYFSTVNSQEANDIVNRSKSFRRGETGVGVSLVYEEFFQYFLGAALLCLFFSYIPKHSIRLVPVFLLFIHIPAAQADSILYSGERNKAESAQKLIESGKADQAAEIYRELQVENPDAPELSYNLGTSLGKGSAKEEARRILTGDNLKGTALEYLGKFNAAGTYVEEKKQPEAKAEYAKLISELGKLPARTADQDKILVEAKKRLERLAQEQSGGEKGQEQEKSQNKDSQSNSGGSEGQKSDENKDEKKDEQGKQNQPPPSPEEDKQRKQREANDRRSMSESEAERILETLNNDESRIQKKFLKKKTEKGKVSNDGKDW